MIVFSKDIETNILRKYHDYLLNLDPILNKINTVKTIHGGGHLYENKGKYLSSPIKEISASMQIKHSDTESYNLTILCEELYRFVNEYIENIHLMMFEELKKITQLTGNVVNNKGKEVSIDLLLDMLEKVEMTFDEEGKPNLSEFVMNPETYKKLKNLEISEENEKRRAQIINKKKKDWDAKKRYRKLSYVD